MNIAIIGYGKMGKTIEEIALSRNHTITATLNQTPTNNDLADADVAIEFSSPEVAYQNVKFCLENNVPVVCGTTGWLTKKSEIERLAIEKSSAFLYGSNFSLGVNLFFSLNEKLAEMMKNFPEYAIQLEEAHHIHKKDAPSGTAISLAEDIIKANPKLEAWKTEETKANQLGIFSIRKDEIPGTHTVTYSSNVDEIEIKHTAFNRSGFALGAVIAAEWIVGKKGVFTMKDVIGL